MNNYWKFIIVLICIFSSCNNVNPKYEREDLLLKYIKSKPEVFKFNDYNILIIRDMKLKCVEAHISYFVDDLIVRVRDSLTNLPLYIISDNNYVNLGCRLLYHTQKTHFVKESTVNMINYGFLLAPMLFHIKYSEIVEWKYMAKLD